MKEKYVVGEVVRAFDPRTFGVVKVGQILKVGSKYASIDFGYTGVAKKVHLSFIVGRGENW